ncbi:enoyl-CoA hydratase [Rhodovulum sp. PH10]|uniref:enoyl-CoA hydratase-related protein n=1 Tax=Rhodovulum sp. PH10 TaxID=1187851 RepID=UPI00027C2260|nr:enoyl-CoA hydratase-related protein [Rhodovulum sp. PH10]EJW09584.1 enoyl-CoA hydratase [Rhodovulum sp. PH10]
MIYKTLQVEVVGRVVLIRLNRPEALNALNAAMAEELARVVARFEPDEGVGCFVLTGSDKAFAAGADIKEMAPRTFIENLSEDYMASWDSAARLRKPVIAAVAGFALGGGCELAMQCDFIIAADNAKFGQPEIKLGVIPGLGATQRLTRAVGKAKAMELILSGRMMGAEEAERAGLVARVVPLAKLVEEAMKTAQAIAGMPTAALMSAKETVGRAFETPLAEGLRFERRVFQALFGTPDQREGMSAFMEKRTARFHESKAAE